MTEYQEYLQFCFSLPGADRVDIEESRSGNMFIYQGMSDFCQNEDQLAVLIGHEMAHSAEKHCLATVLDVVVLAYGDALGSPAK